jgi:hypothetical protein
VREVKRNGVPGPGGLRAQESLINPSPELSNRRAELRQVLVYRLWNSQNSCLEVWAGEQDRWERVLLRAVGHFCGPNCRPMRSHKLGVGCIILFLRNPPGQR